MLARSLTLAVVLTAAAAHAQPVTAPEAVPPLAQIQDDKQLAEILATITQDPAIKVDDPKARPLAQALMTEGVHQLKTQAYDQALANFLEAYNKFPSPKILLNVASTLRDMGRLADAANTYQRYLADPATGTERIAEVKELLIKLDEQLTILTVRVTPKGTDVSIDGGPFVTVGSTLLTRVRPGLHMVRARHGDAATETTVNGLRRRDQGRAARTRELGTPAPTQTAARARRDRSRQGARARRRLADHRHEVRHRQPDDERAPRPHRLLRPRAVPIIPHYEDEPTPARSSSIPSTRRSRRASSACCASTARAAAPPAASASRTRRPIASSSSSPVLRSEHLGRLRGLPLAVPDRLGAAVRGRRDPDLLLHRRQHDLAHRDRRARRRRRRADDQRPPQHRGRRRHRALLQRRRRVRRPTSTLDATVIVPTLGVIGRM